ncbi:phosphoglycerate kinase [Candidatus Woesearchaeota archaeon]|nr:MAG: phosphoglycerate kinase [Candidatus Woesearchaeota archaeon]
MLTVHDLVVEGKRVLVRADLNVPLSEGHIRDDFRIRAFLPTIRLLAERQARQIIILSHLGRPKGNVVPEYSLRPVAEKLGELLGERVALVSDFSAVPEQRYVLLENLRFHEEEEAGDASFANALARLGDAYVQDAFGTLHRRHASIVALPACFPPSERAVGLLVQKELKGLDISRPERPFIAILGFAKLSSKIALIKELLTKVDQVLLGGGVVFTFLKAQGLEIGTSLCEDDQLPTARQLLADHAEKIMLPKDFVISDDIEGTEIFTVDADKIPPTMKGLDIGDASIEEFKRVLDNACTVFWNGPVGVFEQPPFDTATEALAAHLAKSKARVIIGGGDTASAVRKMGYAPYYAHVSTGGGAALQYLAGEELPGLKALEE